MDRVVRVGVLTVALIIPLAACRIGADEEEEAAPPSQRVDTNGRIALTSAEREVLGLETVPAQAGTLTTARLRYGRVVGRPQEDAVVVAPVTGRLRAPAVALGATVAAGEVLVAVEPLADTASRASLGSERRQLEGRLEGAQAEVEAKQADLKRVAALVSSGLATEADRAQAEAVLRSEQARVDSLRRAGGELARMTGGEISLRAPAGGVVATLASDAGSLVQQGAVLARIVQAGPRWIDVAVPPADPVGDEYRVRGASSDLPAHLISRGSVVLSDGTRRDRLEADAQAAAGLIPGVTVPVEVLHEVRGVILPRSSILHRADGAAVFVEVGEGRFEARSVEVVAEEGDRVVLGAGVSAGERIVTVGASSLLGELGVQAGSSDERAR